MFLEKMTMSSIDWVEQIVLPNVGSSRIHWRQNGPVKGTPPCDCWAGTLAFSCLWTWTETLALPGSPGCQASDSDWNHTVVSPGCSSRNLSDSMITWSKASWLFSDLSTFYSRLVGSALWRSLTVAQSLRLRFFPKLLPVGSRSCGHSYFSGSIRFHFFFCLREKNHIASNLIFK